MTPTHARARCAAAAYQAVQTTRQREAAVFRYVVGSLRQASRSEAGPLDRARAASDAFRLWQAVDASVRDANNALPFALRASIAGVAAAAIREASAPAPDLAFLAGVTETVGLGVADEAAAVLGVAAASSAAPGPRPGV